MPRILHVTKYYAPYVGGVERATQDIVDGLRSEFDMRVLACSHTGHRIRDAVEAVPVTRSAAPWKALSMPLSLEYAFDYARLARDVDLLHFHIPFPLAELVALTQGHAGRPVIVSYHFDVWRQRWLMPLLGYAQEAFLRRADRILVSAARIRDQSPYLTTVRNKCAIIPYGVRVEKLTHGVEPFGLPADEFILFVGRLVPYKGVDVLIRAMHFIHVPLLIVGDGPLRSSLEDLACDVGVASRIHFLGRLSTGRMRFCYSRCRLFVLPSVTRTEAFGIVQLEAMAFGKPIVNTDLPTGVPEVAPHDVTGLTVPPNNPDALAAAINSIVQDPKRRDRYGANALARVQEYSLDRYVNGVHQVYRQLLCR